MNDISYFPDRPILLSRETYRKFTVSEEELPDSQREFAHTHSSGEDEEYPKRHANNLKGGANVQWIPYESALTSYSHSNITHVNLCFVLIHSTDARAFNQPIYTPVSLSALYNGIIMLGHLFSIKCYFHAGARPYMYAERPIGDLDHKG